MSIARRDPGMQPCGALGHHNRGLTKVAGRGLPEFDRPHPRVLDLETTPRDCLVDSIPKMRIFGPLIAVVQA
jgi:hypothetical protein